MGSPDAVASDEPRPESADAQAEAALEAGDSPETASVDEEPPESRESDAEMPSNGDTVPGLGALVDAAVPVRARGVHPLVGTGRLAPTTAV